MGESIVRPWLFSLGFQQVKRERPVWGPDASNKRVRVKYRARPRADLPPDEHVTVETMSHEGYWKFIEGPLRLGTAVLVSAETVEDT